MKHIEKRANLYYATLTIPADVRHVLGKMKFIQSTQTDNKPEASRRARALVDGWKLEISKARGTLPNPKDTFWENLRKDYLTSDEGAKFAIEDLAAQASSKIKDPEEASQLYKFATDQGGTLLAPLVEDWNKSQKGAQKSKDQKYRDMKRLADYFVSLEALQPKRIKVWTDSLLSEGVTSSSFIRINGGCRSLWSYLQDTSTVPMETVNPFIGSFKLALRVAVKTDTGRSGSSYTVEQLSMIYVTAMTKGYRPLANLIALGSYTGCRIEELGSLTKDTCKNGMFDIRDSKTGAGIRQVPIHPALLPLVTRMLEESKDGYLIPSNAKNQYGNRTAPLSQKFGRLKTELGFGPELVFHSTRGTLVTLMHRAGVDEGFSADIVGHAKKTMTYGLYSSGSSMSQKLDAISKVNYPGALGEP
jgi:hypothetical protein